MVEAASGIAIPIRLPAPLDRLRRRWDLAASLGAQPHVTVLYPFLEPSGLTTDVRTALAAIAASIDPFPIRFGDVRRFDGVVWVEPQPRDPFVAMTAAVTARWPDHPPYGGLFDEVIPHLTIAESATGPLDAIAAETRRHLPFEAVADRMEVWRQEADGRWRPHWRLRLGR